MLGDLRRAKDRTSFRQCQGDENLLTHHIDGRAVDVMGEQRNLDEIVKDAPVVVYCASGFRASLPCRPCRLWAYSNVRSFPPSYGGWAAVQ